MEKLYPGLAVMFPCKAGGYSAELGFTGNPKERDFAAINLNLEQDNKNDLALQEQSSPDSDDDNATTQVGSFVSLHQHSQDVAAEVKTLLDDVPEGLKAFKFNSLKEAYGWDEAWVQRLIQAGLYHDVGKAHPVFQHLLTQKRPERENGLWAKSDHTRQERKAMKPPKDWRRGFRHEWASALVALREYPEDFLLAYLVACHHGKVRMTVQARPRETKPPEHHKPYALGVWEGDVIGNVEGVTSEDYTLTLDCIALGRESWQNRAIALLHHYGPFQLAYLETLIRIADWRASSISKQ
ncbi:MAG: CRISPR-associated endonuclease Cas3'' [Kamptonema sp. SIO4C4]|nr:CRISPR-associated endonuclease Cas3'' [Kamptonema sp. SIO4C4]